MFQKRLLCYLSAALLSLSLLAVPTFARHGHNCRKDCKREYHCRKHDNQCKQAKRDCLARCSH